MTIEPRVLAHVTRSVEDGAESLDDLTPRQQEIAQLVARGFTNKGVAERLYISPATVRNQAMMIYETLGFPRQGEHSPRVLLARWVWEQQ